MTRRLNVAVRGAVQGVGFRPFVYRLAVELGLPGWVRNGPSGVELEVEGDDGLLDLFLLRLQRDAPPLASIQGLEPRRLDAVGHTGFEIRPSETGGKPRALALPDIATCADCRREIFDPADRRFRYPFTNCTNCGPRFSILEALPYDRSRTSMRTFPMCAECRAEYEDPGHRRFHAQPNACPACGPQLELWRPDGSIVARWDDALRAAARAIRDGEIVAVKGLGGFHLVVDARDDAAVRRLRARKQREEKPLALMVPDLNAARSLADLDPLEERLLSAPEAPIVLVRARSGGDLAMPLAPSVAPGNPWLGLMLPYTPLHHLLLRDLAFPVVATSGNRSEEPICTDEQEARVRLFGIADRFLVHDRPIARPVDDSVARVLLGRELLLRRSRGYAPLPVRAGGSGESVLALGGQLKNAIALAVGGDIFVSQHVGDLDREEAVSAFDRAIRDLARLYEASPDRAVVDAHPDYVSTRRGRGLGLPVLPVQHHHAHVVAAAAENELAGPFLGVAWDGTGYGPDGTVWGGEFLRCEGAGFARVARLRPFRLPGGDAAVREPRRAAIGLLFELLGDDTFRQQDLEPVQAFTAPERKILGRMLETGVNAPWTSSAGRLFDAVAALCGLRQRNRFEGQAAMELEFAAELPSGAPGASRAASLPCAPGEATPADPYALPLVPGVRPGDPAGLDWEPLVGRLLADRRGGQPVPEISRRFHAALAAGIVEVARRTGEAQVVLSGGCFQNRILTREAVTRLEAAGFKPYWHQRVPPNDGGIAVGQAVIARRFAAVGATHVSGGSGALAER